MSVGTAAIERAGIDRADLARYLGWLGVGLGALAFFLTLPPVTARSPIVPLVVGGLGVIAGAISLREGAGRRLGTLAISVGVLGRCSACSARVPTSRPSTRSSCGRR